MENEDDLDNVDNELHGYTVDLNLPWIQKQYFMRNKNIIIEFGLCLFEVLAWTIYAPFMAIKDIIFAFWYSVTKQWYKLSLIAFILDIGILALCTFSILFFIPGLPAIVYFLGVESLLLSGSALLFYAGISTVRFMLSYTEQSFYAYEVNDRNGNKKKVFLSSKIDDSPNLKTINKFKMGHKMLYFYCGNYKIAYLHRVSDIGIKFFTKSPSAGVEFVILISCVFLFPVAVPVLSFVTLFLIFKYSRNENQETKAMIKWFIAFLFLDLLLVFDVLFFISGMPVAIYWISYISLMLTFVASHFIPIAYLGDSIESDIVYIYPCKRGNEKYFKLFKEDLSEGEMRIDAQDIKPSMGVFLPVRDET